MIVEKTRLDERGAAIGTGETYAIDCGLVVTCIGYKTPPIEGVPYEEDRGRFANDGGVIGGGLYCVGWARRGPSGTIGTNRPDGYEVAEKIAADLGPSGGRKEGGAGLDRLLDARGVDIVTFQRLAADRGRRGGPRPRRQPAREVRRHRRNARRPRPLSDCAPRADAGRKAWDGHRFQIPLPGGERVG